MGLLFRLWAVFALPFADSRCNSRRRCITVSATPSVGWSLPPSHRHNPKQRNSSSADMPSGFSNFLRGTGRYSNHVDTGDRVLSTRPSTRRRTAGSYDFHSSRPPQPSPPLPPIPNRYDTSTPASFAYDNGTGRVDSRLLQDQRLPFPVSTTDELAAFIRNRSPNGSSPISSSQYSMDSRFQDLFPGDAGRQERSFGCSRSGLKNANVPFNPAVAGISRRYVAQPVVYLLRGTTRTHDYEGHWLRRGTLRRVPDEDIARSRKLWWRNTKEEAEMAGRYAETSGWYDD